MYDTIAAPHGMLSVDRPTERTPATARAYVAHVLAELVPADVVADVTERALIIASELVTNVYAHTDGGMDLDVALSEDGGSVVITVTDHDDHGVAELGLPYVDPGAVDLLAEHGYGLYLTSVLADALFAHRIDGGKMIGAVIELPGGAW